MPWRYRPASYNSNGTGSREVLTRRCYVGNRVDCTNAGTVLLFARASPSASRRENLKAPTSPTRTNPKAVCAISTRRVASRFQGHGLGTALLRGTVACPRTFEASRERSAGPPMLTIRTGALVGVRRSEPSDRRKPPPTPLGSQAEPRQVVFGYTSRPRRYTSRGAGAWRPFPWGLRLLPLAAAAESRPTRT